MTLRMAVLVAGTLASLFSNLSYAACFPPNKLHLNPSPLEKSNLTQAKFNEIISKAEAVYAPIIKKYNANLVIHRLWKDNTVNANARQDGNTWEVNMYGGLARQPEITPDGFALVVCHELGHHLGGYSFYNDAGSDMTWAANEGQADYFATHACAKEVWKNESELNLKARGTVKPYAKKVCDTNFKQQADRDICYRSSTAGLSLATLLAKLGQATAPKFEKPDPRVVDETYDGHPAAQCRLDTYLAASSCSVAFRKDIIPAKKLSDKFGKEAEAEAGRYSCLARDGWLTAQRPRCWFKPILEFDGLVAQEVQWHDASGNKRVEPGETLSLTIPLKNKLTTPSENITGELFSKTRGVTVENPKVTYPDIGAGLSSRPQEPFTIQVDQNFACGHPFEFTFRATSKTGSREFPISWFAGPKISSDFVLGKSTKDLQVPDAPSDGILIPMTVTKKVMADSLALDIEVDGLYPDENEFKLLTPTGDELPIELRGSFDRGDRATATIALPHRMSLEGQWTLKIRDIQENDTLTIKKVTLRAPLAEAVSCSP